MHINIRTIESTDNKMLADIVRATLKEFGANHEGTVYFDPSTDHLFEVFQNPRSKYFVAEIDDRVVGGGGIFPTEGLTPDTCELVKMYLLPEARGKGIGKLLMEHCMTAAVEFGFSKMYLESMPELKQALSVYEKLGFKYLDAPMGASGHYGCKLWMLRELVPKG